MPVDGSAVLDAAFGPDAVLVSDSLGRADDEPYSVYLVDLDGRIRWRWDTPPGWNAPWLAHDPASGDWLAVVQDPERRAPQRLVRWSAEGTVLGDWAVDDTHDYAFALGGRLLVNAARAFDTRTGEVVAELRGG